MDGSADVGGLHALGDCLRSGGGSRRDALGALLDGLGKTLSDLATVAPSERVRVLDLEVSALVRRVEDEFEDDDDEDGWD